MATHDATIKMIMVAGGVIVILVFYYMYSAQLSAHVPMPLSSSKYVDPSVPCEGFESGVGSAGVAPAEADHNEVYQQISSAPLTAQYPADLFPKDSITSPAELLPKDTNSAWAQSVPNVPGELGDANFLTAGYHMGISTVSQNMKNANRQLRSEPPNPQVIVSPWMQTSIGPDLTRRPFELNDGSC
jgi:hypothetical protein